MPRPDRASRWWPFATVVRRSIPDRFASVDRPARPGLNARAYRVRGPLLCGQHQGVRPDPIAREVRRLRPGPARIRLTPLGSPSIRGEACIRVLRRRALLAPSWRFYSATQALPLRVADTRSPTAKRPSVCVVSHRSTAARRPLRYVVVRLRAGEYDPGDVFQFVVRFDLQQNVTSVEFW